MQLLSPQRLRKGEKSLAEKHGRNQRPFCRPLLLAQCSNVANSRAFVGRCIAVPVSQCTKDWKPVEAGLACASLSDGPEEPEMVPSALHNNSGSTLLSGVQGEVQRIDLSPPVDVHEVAPT